MRSVLRQRDEATEAKRAQLAREYVDGSDRSPEEWLEALKAADWSIESLEEAATLEDGRRKKRAIVAQSSTIREEQRQVSLQLADEMGRFQSYESRYKATLAELTGRQSSLSYELQECQAAEDELLSGCTDQKAKIAYQTERAEWRRLNAQLSEAEAKRNRLSLRVKDLELDLDVANSYDRTEQAGIVSGQLKGARAELKVAEEAADKLKVQVSKQHEVMAEARRVAILS